MKINIIVPHLKISGGVMVLVIYAHHLALLGHDVVLYVEETSLRNRLLGLLGARPKWIKNFKLNIKWIEEIRENDFLTADIMLFSSHKHALMIKNFDEKFGKKIYLVQHDERLYHSRSNEAADSYNLPFRFFAVSTWLKETLKNEFNQEADLILNTVDKDIFFPHEIRKEDDHLRILLLHHSYEWKGTSEGAAIVNGLKKDNKRIDLVIYGARNENAQCDEYHYKPFGVETAKLFSSCDIFLCPSWDEGFGLPSLEAMACGCALVTYDNGGSRDFAFDGKTAMVAKRRDKIDLLNKLKSLINDKELRDRIGMQGAAFVNSMPTWREQAKKMEEIFLSL